MEGTFAPVGPRRTFEGAVAQIADRVRLGELQKGERLPSERDLAATMQISRPTLREAVRVLTKAEVLEVRKGSGGGVYVASDFVPLDLVRNHSDVRLHEVGGVLEARRMIEPRVAQLAAANAREEDFQLLQQIIDSQARMVDVEPLDEDAFLQLDTRFHLRIARASGNATIVSIMRNLLRQLEIARDLAMHEPPTAPWVIDIHERTLSAIRGGDPRRVDAVMDEHLAALEDAWEKSSGRSLVRTVPDFLLSSARGAGGRDGGDDG